MSAIPALALIQFRIHVPRLQCLLFQNPRANAALHVLARLDSEPSDFRKQTDHRLRAFIFSVQADMMDAYRRIADCTPDQLRERATEFRKMGKTARGETCHRDAPILLCIGAAFDSLSDVNPETDRKMPIWINLLPKKQMCFPKEKSCGK